MHSPVAARFGAVIFDMGDILYDASVWRRWLTTELQSRGIDVTYHDLVDRWEALLVEVYRGQADYWERFADLTDSFGLDAAASALIMEAARRKAVEVSRLRTPMDQVPETLSCLRDSGVRLAVLSDSESGSEKLRSILRDMGIDAFFDAVVTSADIGFVKPEKEAFLAAARAVETDAAQCAFVGHDSDELDGARSAGIYTVAYNNDRDVRADAYVEEFGELADLVLGAMAR